MDLPGQSFDYDNFKLFDLYKNHDILHHKLHEMFHDKFRVENIQIHERHQGVFIGGRGDPSRADSTCTPIKFPALWGCNSEGKSLSEPTRKAGNDSNEVSTDAIICIPAWIHQGPRKAKALPSTTKVGLSRPQARRIEDCLGRQTEILQISPWRCPKYGISSRTFSRARVDFSSTLEPKLATNSPPQEALIRLPDVLSRFPVSRSKWYAGVKAGTYPQPIKEGRRTAMWRVSDVDRLILSLTTK